ncbi:nrm1-like protein [Phlyctema vagabunda]|uniref:Nrm1-like protein n=1 Tax=Phlyctema vagabunda TaxID=108571 RepID=A0ABR4PS59_9HELO
MSSPRKKHQPEAVADKVLKRAEVSKMARKLQNRLALAQFKTDRGWEDLTLDTIEPKVDEELRRRRPMSSGDFMSDSSSSTSNSDVPYSNSRRHLASSPLKAPFFSDAMRSGASSTARRKRTYQSSFQHPGSSTGGSRKRIRSSPPGGRPLQNNWKDHHHLAQSSPIKPRKQTHFTTSTGPDLSFFRGSMHMPDSLHTPNFAAGSDDDDNTLPLHSFQIRSSPPRTPPPVRSRGSVGRGEGTNRNGKSGQEGADLLLYLATSPSPANTRTRSKMHPPQTPPPKHMALPSSMMSTPGGGGSGGLLSMFGGPQTPSQTFDFADFVNITPSPAQNAWPRTPAIKTPLTVGRKRLTFDTLQSPTGRDGHI